VSAPVSAETANIDAARGFFTSLGEHLSSQLSARVATARATLAGRRTDTATLATLDRISAHIAAMAATCESGAEHLDAYHGSLEQAVNATPEAADTDFYRPGSGPSTGPADERETPVIEDDDSIDPGTGMTQRDLAAFRDYNDAAYPFLPRHTEKRRIEAEHDARAELVDQGRRTDQWYRTAAAVLRARTEEIDGMVAALRPGDHVRLVDDPDAVVCSVREIRDGNDGWVWLGLLRTREDGTKVGTGCRARGVDLVATATDDEHADMVKAELDSDLRNKWITLEEYDAALARLTAAPATAAHPDTAAEEDAVLQAWSKLKVIDTSPQALRIRAEAEQIRRRRQPAAADNPYTGKVTLDELDPDPELPLADVAQGYRWMAQSFDDKARAGNQRAADDAFFWHAAADVAEAAAAAEPPASRAPGPDTDDASLQLWRRDEMVLAQAQELYGDEDTPEAAQLQRDAAGVERRRRLAHRTAVAAGVTPCVASQSRSVPCVHPDGDHHAGLCFAADGGSWPRHTSWAAPETWADAEPGGAVWPR
jgi:hypothetical protein